MAAYATRTGQGQAIIGPPGPDGKRKFVLTWYAANFNDANTFCSSQAGGPLAELATAVKPGGRCHLTKITTWHDAATAGVNNTYHYWTIYLSKSTTTPPLTFSPTWWTTDVTDVHVWECDVPVDPSVNNVAMLYSSGQSATDDLYMVFEGWFDG